MPRCAFAVAGISVLAFLIVSSPPAGACPVGRGQRLVLASQGLDPDVFLWDSPDRLQRYTSGEFDVETVLKHTTLIKAFTSAVALGCRPTVVHSDAAGAGADSPLFIVGVRVASGLSRGRWGWVLSSDIRPVSRQMTSRRHG